MNYVKSTCIILVLALVLPLAGCQSGNKSIDKLNSEEYKKLTTEIDRITSAFGTSGQALPIAEEFNKADDRKKAEMALELADDMAQAQLFGMVNNEILALSGEAVKAYPHPLLLNNYAALLLDGGMLEESLYLFQKAELQDAANPVLLTNIANTYLELDDFSAAENYAKKALSTAPDFGAAHQVLTTVYLQREQHKLAAQHLLKSSKHCFNDITTYHFESFLDAVGQLNPVEDDYPLDEQELEEFRKTAIQNVDTKDMNDSVDTPRAQLTLKPFPQLGGPDHLARSYDYLAGEGDKFHQKYSAVSSEIMKLSNEIYNKRNSGSKSEGLIYPVDKNLRQIYALEVLQSYYDFKIKQSHSRYFKKIKEIQQENNDEIQRIEKNYEEKKKTMENENLSPDQMLADLFGMVFSEENKPPQLDAFAAAALATQKLAVEQHREQLDKSKVFSSRIINESEDCYYEIGQLLEEYWLKAGGLLKCLADEDTFKMYDLKRQQVVYNYTNVPITELESQASFLQGLEFKLRMEEMQLNTVLSFAKQAEKAMERIKEALSAGDTLAQIEKEAISFYQEKNDLGAIGAEADFFGISGSIQYASEWDGDKLKLNTGSPLGGKGKEYTLDGQKKGTSNSYAVHGVTVMGDTSWFTDAKAVQDALKKSGKAGKVLGSIGLGYSSSNTSGQYAVAGSNNHITDRGVVFIRESSVGVGPFSKTEKVEIRKSLMTGVAFKYTSTKYKFKFLTYEK